MNRNITSGILGGMLVILALSGGCSSEKAAARKVLDDIQQRIQAYNAQLLQKGIQSPAEALVYQSPVEVDKSWTRTVQKKSTSQSPGTYWLYKNGAFSELSHKDAETYKREKTRFNGSRGDYYLFQFSLFPPFEEGRIRIGVLILPDDQKVQIEY